MLLVHQALKPSRCQQALLILIQHNCILPLQTSANHDVEYEIETDHILHRLRYPRFLLHIREYIGETHEFYLETLLEHGRLRSRHLIALVSQELGGTVGFWRVSHLDLRKDDQNTDSMLEELMKGKKYFVSFLLDVVIVRTQL